MLIPVAIEKPDGAGPFPAIVIMHDCSGLNPGSSGAPRRWAKLLVERGYVVAMPDSFSNRGYPTGVCTDASRGRIDVSPRRRVEDARDTAAFLRHQPYVDGKRIGVMGGSHGGTTTVLSLAAPEPAFRAGVALYPRCSAAGKGYHAAAPLLILAGEIDDWTPAEECRTLATTAGAPIALKVYPGAHHSFDSPNPVRYVASRINPAAPGGRGATTGGNPEAWADSIKEVDAFFARNLR
jgi:dienelactone hydrolase